MKKLIVSLFFILLCVQTVLCQVKIHGIVISKKDKEFLPGVAVVEKGTKNGTVTDLNGEFSLDVAHSNATLVFSSVGMQKKEVLLNGETELKVYTKLDCYKDFFDGQSVNVYVNSGVLNDPVGGKIEIASPWFIKGVIKGLYSYQTNFRGNSFQEGQIVFAHYISNCDFDIDFGLGQRDISFVENFNVRVRTFETEFNTGRMKFIAGYAHLSLDKPQLESNDKYSGVLIGMGTYFNMPLYPVLIGKVALFKENIEYQISIQGGYKKFLYFINFYKFDNFHELSLGVGTYFGYRFKKQKNQ